MSPDSSQHHSTHQSSLRDYLRIVRHRKWVVIVAVVIVPAAALLYSLRQESLYRSTAEVLLSQQNLAYALTGTPSTMNSDPTRDAQTQAEVARVPYVVRRALALAHAQDSVGDFLAASSVSSSQDSNILTFSVINHVPSRAARLTTAYATAFIAYRNKLDTASLTKAKQEVDRQLERLAAQGKQDTSLYTQLAAKAQTITTIAALQTSNASLIDPASTAVRVQPRTVRNTVLAGFLGLVLGIPLAFLWETLDTRVRSAEEIGAHVGLPLLGRLPTPPRKLAERGGLVMRDDSLGKGAEVFRILRTNLEFVLLSNDVKTILVTSALDEEGKSTTVANLALALAHSGRSVVLVDLDLRRPVLNRFFSLPAQPGLTSVAIGHTVLDEVLARVPLTDADDRPGAGGALPDHLTARSLFSLASGSLHVLPTGPLPPNAGEFVSSAALEEILMELRRRFDVVLIDTPPALQIGDALTLSRKVDGIVIVARTTVVRRPVLAELRRALEASPAVKLGFVATSVDSGESLYGYGYYSRRYGPLAWKSTTRVD